MTNREFRKFAFKIIFTRTSDKQHSSGKEAVNSSLGFVSSADRSSNSDSEIQKLTQVSVKQSQYISSLNSSLSHLNRREISSHESMSHQSVSHPEISFDESFNTSTTTAYSSSANRLTPSIESHQMGPTIFDLPFCSTKLFSSVTTKPTSWSSTDAGANAKACEFAHVCIPPTHRPIPKSSVVISRPKRSDH